jgi:Tfp pilus assembly protein PilO
MRRLWQRLSKREKGLVLLTLGVFILVLIRYFAVSPFLERREWMKNQLEIQPQRLAKNLRFLDQKTEIMSGLEKARAEIKAMEPSLLTGDTPSVSASDLQQAVQNLAVKEGTQVISTRVLNPEPMGSFTRIPIQMEITGQIDQVANLIKGIDAAERLLVIQEINIRSLFSPGAGRRGEGAPPVAQSLRVSLVVSGFSRSQTAGAGDAQAPSAKKEKSPATKSMQKQPEEE